MAMCLPVYGKGIIFGSAKKIWNALKLEVELQISFNV
jgi:hypothetical protein